MKPIKCVIKDCNLNMHCDKKYWWCYKHGIVKLVTNENCFNNGDCEDCLARKEAPVV